MSKWIKFKDQKPPSFIDIIYCRKFKDGTKCVGMAWVESAPEEDLALWDVSGASMDEDDEKYDLIAWMKAPKFPKGLK